MSMLVRPRVVSQNTGDSLYLEDALEPVLAGAETGAICLFGSSGAGKSCALRYLSARLPKDRIIELLDEPERARVAETAERMIVIYTATEPLDVPHLARFWLTPWGEDEALDYLLATHKDRCASVMRRIRESAGRDSVETPELWTICLEEMAADESVVDCDDAIRRHLRRRIPPRFLRQARAIAFRKTVRPDAMDAHWVTLWGHPGFLGFLLGRGIAKEDIRLLRHPRVRLLLAAERLFDHGERGFFLAGLESGLPRELIPRAGRLLRDNPDAVALLERELPGRTLAQPMGASLLHAARIGWRPPADSPFCWFRNACFPHADWRALRLPSAQLESADLTGAMLTGSKLDNANLAKAVLRGATLWGSSLTAVNATEADLSYVNLGHVSAGNGVFLQAKLEHADLESAHLPYARFGGANLTKARFRRADLTGALFQVQLFILDQSEETADARRILRQWGGKHFPPGLDAAVPTVDLTDVDFTGAELQRAWLSGVDLRTALLSGARFGEAHLERALLDGVSAPGGFFEDACLNDAMLTGSFMPGASFRRATLCGARLGDVEWERVDLRKADLRKATFHMGSSRSGLVFAEPSEGTRTGFYTDEYADQHFRAPEEIRVANLRGADLRGALLDGTDFYLVDLREARYSSEQAEYLRRCGAILETRV